LPTPVISNNAPGFKYKYPEASPTPAGEDDTNWNKIYTAADSRMYNKHGKDANNSRKFRLSGETRKLALTMLEEKKAKEAAGVPPRATPKPKIPAAKKTQPATTKKEPSTGSRDATPGLDMMSMSISEKIKFEGRARKTSSAAPPSNSGTPAPSSAPKMSSPAPPAAKVEKPATKKKGTAAPVKKQVKRQKVEGMLRRPLTKHSSSAC
jgi:COMPASS component SPP1